MKKNSLIILTLGTLLLTATAVTAQTITPAQTPKFGEEVREMREQNNEERRKLMEGNKEARQQLREKNKTEREELMDENKEEREEFRETTKELLKGKTPEEKLTLMPTIKADRKALFDQNKAERQGLWKAQWDSKKALTENIRTNMDGFRATVRSRWADLWNSFWGKK